ILLLFVAVILFGSWFPFRFDVPVDFPDWRLLVDLEHVELRRGDVLANVLLYAPLGFFVPRALALRGQIRPIAVAALAGLALSTTVEVVQIFIPGRTTSLVDVASNSAGAALGALGSVLAGGHRLLGRGRGVEQMPLFPLFLAAAWL